MNLKQLAEQLLGKTLNPTDGIDACHIQRRENQLEITLPFALHSFYATLGNVDLFTGGFQHFLPLDEWFVYEDKLVFLQEHQGGIFWAVSLHDGQTIYQTADVDFNEPVTWYAEDFTLDEFLPMLLYWQCVMADDDYHNKAGSGFTFFASLYASDKNIITRSFVDGLTEQFSCVNDVAGLEIYWQPNTIIMGIVNEETQTYDTLFACSKHEKDFDKLIDDYGFMEL